MPQNKKENGKKSILLKIDHAQADHQGLINTTHHLVVQMSDFIRQSLFINSTNLFQQNNRITVKSISFGIDFHMSRQLSLLDLGCNRGDDHGGAKPIANVILNYQNRPNPTLFGSDHRG